MVKTSFTEKTYVVGTHWNWLIPFQCVPTTFVTENKEENNLETYVFQVSCPLSLPLLRVSIKIPGTLYLNTSKF